MNNPADTLAARLEAANAGLIGAAEHHSAIKEAIASLKGEAVVPALEVFRVAGGDVECCPNPTAAEAMDCLRDLRQCYEESLTTPPAPQAGLSAWVSEMKTSTATEYWVCVGWGRNFGEYMTVRMSHMRSRSELEVAEWNHLFGKGTKPCIADPKFSDPEQVSSTPSPAPQGGGERFAMESLPVNAPMQHPERNVAEQAYTQTAFNYEANPVGCRDWTIYWRGWWHRAVISDLATPPAQQPGEVGEVLFGWDGRMTKEVESMMVEFKRLFPSDTSSETRRRGNDLCQRFDKLRHELRSLAPKEKGNG